MNRILFSSLFVACTAFAQTVSWAFETTPILSTVAGDPAFIFQPTPAPQGTSFIIGTDRVNNGLYVWPPTPGAAPTLFQVGIFSSADSRGSLLVAVSQVTNSLSVFALVNGGLVQFDSRDFNISSPRHVALRQTPAGQFEVIVDNGTTTVDRYQLAFLSGGRVGLNPLSSIPVAETPSGLAVDDRTGTIYISQPSRGVMVATPPLNPHFLVSIDAGQLGTAVGGVDLYQAADGRAFVMTTAPNEGTVNVHDKTGGFLATLSFTGDGGQTVRAEELDVFEPATPDFPRGVLVLQDALGGNYKIVSLEAVNAVFPLPAPFVPSPISVDGGVGIDGGQPSDAGESDGGADGGTDGGTADGGVDGGPVGGGGGGGTGGTGGGIGGDPRAPASANPMESSCGCTGGPFALLPALLSLWFVRRRRTAP